MMMFELAIITLLTLINAFLSLSELAIVSSRKARLKQLIDEEQSGAETALELAENPTLFLSTVQTGITLVGVGAGAFGGATLAEPLGVVFAKLPYISQHAETVAFVTVVMVITLFQLILGELIPKRLAITNPEMFACFVARPMRILAALVGPVVSVLGRVTEAAMRMFGWKGDTANVVTQEEVKTLILEGTEAGVFDPREKEMIDGVLRLADRPLRAIMTPRPDIVWLDVEADEAAILDAVRRTGHSRYPVCRGDVDEIVGVVHTRDLLLQKLIDSPLDLAKLVRTPLVMQDTVPLLKALETFRESGRHMTFVVDEYGTIEGIVTLKDLLEAIAGDLPHAAGASSEAVKRADGSWLLDGSIDAHEAENILDIEGLVSEDDSYHTLAGFLLSLFGHIPKAGEAILWNGVRFEVVDMDGRRIDKVLCVLPQKEEAAKL